MSFCHIEYAQPPQMSRILEQLWVFGHFAVINLFPGYGQNCPRFWDNSAAKVKLPPPPINSVNQQLLLIIDHPYCYSIYAST
jgi:hypothetical protein